MLTQPTVTFVKLVQQELNSGHENAQGILSKARGYCANMPSTACSKTSECKELLKCSKISDKDNLRTFNNDQSNICYICVLDQEHQWCVQR